MCLESLFVCPGEGVGDVSLGGGGVGFDSEGVLGGVGCCVGVVVAVPVVD